MKNMSVTVPKKVDLDLMLDSSVLKHFIFWYVIIRINRRMILFLSKE